MIALVRGVIAASIRSGAMQYVAGSMSTKTGVRLEVLDDLGRRRKGMGRRDDLVAGPDAHRLEPQVQRRRRGVDRHRLDLTAEVRRELVLELFCLGAGRQPARAQGVQDLRDLLLADLGESEGQEGLLVRGHASLAREGRLRPSSSAPRTAAWSRIRMAISRPPDRRIRWASRKPSLR